MITEDDIEDLLVDALGDGDDIHGESFSVRAFREADPLDRHARGVILRLGDGSEFQISIATRRGSR